MVQRVQTPHAGRTLPLLWSRILCTFALILGIIVSPNIPIGLAFDQSKSNNGTGMQTAKDLMNYDSEFFSIKYPSSWHISSEEGFADIPGASGVTLLNYQNAVSKSSRLTPHSNMGSVLGVTLVPRSSLPGSGNLSASEIVDSYVDYSFSSEKLKYIGAQLLSDNYTSLSGIPARSIFYTKDGYYICL